MDPHPGDFETARPTLHGRDCMTTPRSRAARADGPDRLMNVIRTIDRTLKESRSDYGQLTPRERYVKRVDVFDSYSTNDGFDGFFRQRPAPRRPKLPVVG